MRRIPHNHFTRGTDDNLDNMTSTDQDSKTWTDTLPSIDQVHRKRIDNLQKAVL